MAFYRGTFACFLAIVFFWAIAESAQPPDPEYWGAILDSELDGNNSVKKPSNCTFKTFPCSQTLIGNLILMFFYGVLLGSAAKLIADGAEMLLDVGLPPAIIGGLVLPLLGAVPDAAIIIVSGMGPKSTVQTQLQVGMGTLAGSTIMLLTLPWLGSLIIGRCDIAANGIARDGTGQGRFSFQQGVSVLPDVKNGIVVMFLTCLPFFIIQGADWHLMSTQSHDLLCNITHGEADSGTQPKYMSHAALATMIFCFMGLIAYMAFQVYDATSAQRRASKRKNEVTVRRIAARFYQMTSRTAFQTNDAPDSGESQSLLNQEGIQKKYFNAWKVRRAAPQPNVAPAAEPEKEEDEPEEKEESKGVLAAKSAAMLAFGVAVVCVFSDPMCDVLTELTNTDNESYIPVKAFYVSFVVTPICSNASELVSSLMFAAKRKRINTTMTYSQLYGAATMNNTLCLGVFMALVYFKDLEWEYSAEVLVILLVELIVGIAGYRETYRVWLGIPVVFLYVLAIVMVAVLEGPTICWK